MWLCQCVQKSGTTVFEQIEDKLESFRSFIIGVRDTLRSCMVTGEIGHSDNLALIFGCAGAVKKFFDIVVIHGDDHVELSEIVWTHLPGPVGQLQATP